MSRLALPYFCAVPPGTPIAAKGVNSVPAAGPYYVASYTPGQGAVLKRNPNYRGSRPHALDEIDYSVGIGNAQSVKEIETRTTSKVSPMPAGLVDVLTTEEILDLIAYLEASGQRQHVVFSKK